MMMMIEQVRRALILVLVHGLLHIGEAVPQVQFHHFLQYPYEQSTVVVMTVALQAGVDKSCCDRRKKRPESGCFLRTGVRVSIPSSSVPTMQVELVVVVELVTMIPRKKFEHKYRRDIETSYSLSVGPWTL